MSDKLTLEQLKNEGLELPPKKEVSPLTNVNSEGVVPVNPSDYYEKKPEKEPRDFSTELMGDVTSVIKKESEQAAKMLEEMKLQVEEAKSQGKKIVMSEEAYEGMQNIEVQLGKGDKDTAIESPINQNTESYKEGRYDEVLPGLNSIVTKPKDTDSKGQIIEDPDKVIIATREARDKGVVIDEDDVTKGNISDVFDDTDNADTDEDDLMSDFEETYEEYDDSNNTSDIDDDMMKSNDDSDNEEFIKILKSKIREKVQPHAAKLDLASFTIASPVKTVGLFTNSEDSTKYKECVLFSSDCVVGMKKFKGTEIEALGKGNNKSVRKYNEDILKTFWNHLDPATRPEFEVFIRTVSYNDFDNLFFAAIESTFNESNNFVPYYCQKNNCGDIEIVEVETRNHIKFSNDEQKEKYTKLLEQGITELKSVAKEQIIVPITDEFAISIKEPSLYDVLIEPMYLNEANRTKYKDELAIAAYIDTLYKIDQENRKLIPIDLYNKSSKNKKDTAELVKNKYRSIITFLEKLDSDQFSTVQALIAKAATKDDNIEYVIPEHKCEKCGTVIPEMVYTAREILFTRHQLATLANI